MNTDTNDETFALRLADKTILAQLIDVRHPEMEISPTLWKRFSGAELWGLLYHHDVQQVYILLTEPVHMIVLMNSGDGIWHEYIRIDWRQYLEFTDYFGAYFGSPIESKCNWQKEGF